MYRKLPKEQQTAYERWELASFEEDALLAGRKKPLSPDEVDFHASRMMEPKPGEPWELQEEEAAEAEAGPETGAEAEAVLEAAATEADAEVFAGEDAPAGEAAGEGGKQAAASDALQEEEAAEVEAGPETGAEAEAVLEAAATEADAEVFAGEDAPAGEAADEGVEQAAFPSPPVMAPTVTQATIEDVHALIEGLRKEAREAGYRAGVEEGMAQGLEEGRTKGYEEGLAKGLEEGTRRGETEGFEKGYGEGKLEGEEYARTLKAAAAGFAADVARANEAIAGDVLALALDFAKAMMKTALKVKPELLVPVVADAVRYLPSLQQPAVLYLNPEDAVIVRQAMGEELEKAGMRLAEEDVPRGSCRIETGSNQIDSSLATRWQRLAGSLGRESDWME